MQVSPVLTRIKPLKTMTIIPQTDITQETADALNVLATAADGYAIHGSDTWREVTAEGIRRIIAEAYDLGVTHGRANPKPTKV